MTLDEAVGRVIGRYKLLEKVGEGGCGVVYVAEQTEPVRRRVALKVIKAGMDTKQVIARFEAERQALAMMDHPNIARVLDAGSTEVGRPFFVMELVRGIRITDYCDQNNLPTKDRLDLLIKVCQAIQHAHQKGIIHRDIKPSNILVTVNDGMPVPKVIDFGIAKATEGRLTDATVYTQLHQFIGTPAYMSPEQAEMTSLDIDTRSDIYSLGVLLYELLAGRTPFDAQEMMAAGLDAMRKAIREITPTRPSTRLATLQGEELSTTARRRSTEAPRLLRQLQGDLDWIVMKCLEKDRTRRYETANGLAADLKRHLSNEPVAARPPSRLYEFQKTVRRHKFGFAAATMIMVTLAGGVVVTSWQAVRAKHAEQLAASRLLESEKARQDAEAISKFMSEVFQSPNPERDGRTITVAETLDKGAKKVETDLASQPERRAKLQATLASTYAALGVFPESIALQEKVRDYYLVSYGLENTNTLEAMMRLAISYDYAGRRDEATKLQEVVVNARRKMLGPEHSETIDAMSSLAIFYVEAGRVDEAMDAFEQVLAFRRKVLGAEHPATLDAMNNLGNCYDVPGHLAKALTLREEVLRLRRKVNGPEHPAALKAMNNLANSYEHAGRLADALTLREEVLRLRRKVLGAEHPATLNAMGSLEVSYNDANRWDEAIKMGEEALMLRHKVQIPEHPDVLEAMRILASSYEGARRLSEALKLREEVLPLSRKVLGPDHPATLGSLQQLAICYAEVGRRDESLNVQEEWLAALRQRVTDHPADMAAANQAATIHLWLGRTNEYQILCQKLLAAAAGSQNPEVHDQAARPCLLWSQTGPDTLKPAVASARQALAPAKPGDGSMPRIQLTAGLAAYREGKLAEAETLLSEALKSATTRDERGLALAFRAMARWGAGLVDSARADLAEVEKLVPPAPKRTTALELLANPEFIGARLALQEASGLMNPSPSPRP